MHLYLYNPADFTKTFQGRLRKLRFTNQSFLTVLGSVMVQEGP